MIATNQIVPYGLIRENPPAISPVSLIEAKDYLRYTFYDQDQVIESLVRRATALVEETIEKQLITANWYFQLQEFPGYSPYEPNWFVNGSIRLPRPPLQEILSIEYFDADGNWTDLDPEIYWTDFSEPGRISLRAGEVWPATSPEDRFNVFILYKAGYGDTGADIPEPLRQAILLLVGNWYENREATITGTIIQVLDFGVESLLAPYRTMWL